MKRIYNKDQRLESHKFFPYVAWALVIIFAFFVYHITTSVSDRATEIQNKDNDTTDQYLVPIDELRRQNAEQ